VNQILTVTCVADGGAGTLRAALEHAVDHPDARFTIRFDLPGRRNVIVVKSPLQVLAGVTLDGPVGDDGEPVVEIDGSLLEGDETCSLAIAGGVPSLVRNLSVTGGPVGIGIYGPGGHSLVNCVLRDNRFGIIVKADDCAAERLMVQGAEVISVAVQNARRFRLTDSRIGCDRQGGEARPNMQGVTVYEVDDCCIVSVRCNRL